MFTANFHARKLSSSKTPKNTLSVNFLKPDLSQYEQDLSPMMQIDKNPPKFIRLGSAGSIRNSYGSKLFMNETPTYLGVKSTKSNTMKSNSPSSAQLKMDFTSAAAPYTQNSTPNFSMSVYQTLKDQKKFFLTATSPKHLRQGSASIIDPSNQTTKLIITDKNVSFIQEGSQKKPLKNDKVSPRKRLALHGARIYSAKKTTLKDLLVESQNVVISPPATANTNIMRANSSSPKRAALLRKESYIKKLKEITEAKAKKAEQEEASVIQAIEKNAEKGFNKTMDLYNKYYTGYFFEPAEKFKSKKDLKIKTELFVSANQTIMDGSPLTHTLNTPKFKKNLKRQTTGVSFSGDFRLDSNRDKQPPMDQSPHIRSPFSRGNTKSLKGFQQGNLIGDDFVEELQEKTDQVVERIFADGMEEIRNTVDNLQKVQDLLQTRGALSPEEEEFLFYVKEGKTAVVIDLLKKNPDLVLTRDGRNLTALHWAVKRRHLKLVEMLCRSGADICAKDMVGRMPTDIAKRFNEPMIEQILEFAREEQISRNRNKFRNTGLHTPKKLPLIVRENSPDTDSSPNNNL